MAFTYGNQKNSILIIMELLNKSLFWISTGLLVPTIVGLLYFLGKGLLLLGEFYGVYMNRLKLNKGLFKTISRLHSEELAHLEAEVNSQKSSLLSDSIHLLLKSKNSKVRQEKVLTDFEMTCEKDLDRFRTLSKMGPMLGLMGTLIPLGPALASLAAGDISVMAKDMQLAFNSTVVGLVIGALGYLMLQTKQRWSLEDLNRLEFIHELITEASCEEEEKALSVLR
jgi:biopolymer transport protein ExbB/TolQ